MHVINLNTLNILHTYLTKNIIKLFCFFLPHDFKIFLVLKKHSFLLFYTFI